MKYFETLPTVINLDSNNNVYLLKNLMNRAVLVPELSKNPLLFYQYTIQDGDTPESIAYKYYNDQYRYWILLHGNNIIDPQWDWPLTPNQFDLYIIDKYRNDAIAYYDDENVNDSQIFAYITSTPHHYEKWITSTDNTSLTKSLKTMVISQEDYLAYEDSSQTFTLPDGQTVTREWKKVAVSLYDYEFETNENKRNINIVQSQYVEAFEETLQNLME